MKLIFKFMLISVLLLLLVACESNRYRKAVSSYYDGKYTISVEEIDSYLKEAKNGAYITNAELIRSKSYQELALRAYEANNLALTTRFAILANSEATDTLLARCYYDYAQQSFDKRDKSKGLEFYDQILLEIPESRFTAEIIYYKMNDSIKDSPENYQTAWEYYKQLYPEFEGDYYEIEGRKIIADLIPYLISDALAADSEAGLEMLLEFTEYPVGNTKEVKAVIAQIYIRIAEDAIVENDFIKADENYKAAVFYDPEVRDYVRKRLLDTADQYISSGLEYVKKRDFENAFLLFNRTFDVIPGYKKALDVIQETSALLNRIEQARDLYEQGKTLEKTNLRSIFSDVKVKLTVSERNDYEIRRFRKILGLYEQAYELDPLPKYRDQIAYTNNIIRYYKEPDVFAVEIIKGYKSFIMEKAINDAMEYLLRKNTTSAVTDTGWEVLVASGNYNYEVRYSLMSISDKLFFRWLVNLRTKEITPINSLSEQAMNGNFVKDEEEENDKTD